MPPDKVPIVAMPLTVVVPPLMVVAVRLPAEIVPPEMSEVSRPATLTSPCEMPDAEMVASLAKVAVPPLLSEASVMTPVVPVKLSVPAL